MKYDIRIGQYYELNNPSKYGYTAEYVDKKDNKLHTIGDYQTHQQALAASKRFIEQKGGKNDRILSVAGNDHHYTGKNWRVDHPSN